HAADRPDLLPGRGGTPDRRPLHDGARGGRDRARAARLEALRSLPLGHVPAPARDARAATRAGAGRCRDRRARPWSGGEPVRERWLGATGRKVPEIAVEGELDLPEDVLLLEGVGDVGALRRAHDSGRPVVVRADSPETVKAALARPEVASVLV